MVLSRSGTSIAYAYCDDYFDDIGKTFLALNRLIRALMDSYASLQAEFSLRVRSILSSCAFFFLFYVFMFKFYMGIAMNDFGFVPVTLDVYI